MRRVGLMLALAMFGGCAPLAKSPEYRDRLCATAPECSMDRERGCQVCQCSPSTGPERGVLPSGVAPDRRVR